MTRLLDRLALGATVLCPLFLVHGRGLAEACIDVVAVLFLLRSAVRRDWRWTRQAWVGIAALWWLWLVLCSIPPDLIPTSSLGQGGEKSFVQALLTVRFLLFAAGLQGWVLRDVRHQRWLAWLLWASFAYIALQLLLQAVIGHNLFGMPRFHDGTLTGPYDHPRAAAPLSRLLFPTLLPACAWLIMRGRRPGGGRGRQVAVVAAAIAVLLAGLALMVLAGQRVPLLLAGLGLLVAGLILPRLRLPLLACLALVPVLVGISAVVSPRSFGHLVLLFRQQMEHFGGSPYGLILGRALEIARANPLTGRGFDGFRTGCPLPAYFHGVPPLSPAASDGGGAAFCVQHPHNHYLQALTDAGLPGLLLFCMLVLAWLLALRPGRMEGRRVVAQSAMQHAWRTGLFVAVLLQEWPVASASAFTNMPLGGWFFLILGLGLAAATPYMQRPASPIPVPPRG
ncbi:O-antigen ligase family protein [Lichenicoccus roseus]|nr:O-antigen ligase family protein [Lichenicoccus roseus]